MYNMYPDFSQQTQDQSITLRASSAELQRWESEGAEAAEPFDYLHARHAEVASRVILEQCQQALDRDFGRIVVKDMFGE